MDTHKNPTNKAFLLLLLLLVIISVTSHGVLDTTGPFEPTSLADSSPVMLTAAEGRKLKGFCLMPCPNRLIPDGVCLKYDEDGSFEDKGCCTSCCSAEYLDGCEKDDDGN